MPWRGSVGRQLETSMPLKTVDDLPFVYRYNLPTAAQEVFRRAYNETWQQAEARRDRDWYARRRAIDAVKERYEKDQFGIWRLRE